VANITRTSQSMQPQQSGKTTAKKSNPFPFPGFRNAMNVSTPEELTPPIPPAMTEPTVEDVRQKYEPTEFDTPVEVAHKQLGLRRLTMDTAIKADYINERTSAGEDPYLINLASARHTLLQQKIHRWNEELEIGIKTIREDPRFSDEEKSAAIELYLARSQDPISVPAPKKKTPLTADSIDKMLKSDAGLNLPEEDYANLEELRDELSRKEAERILRVNKRKQEATVGPETPQQPDRAALLLEYKKLGGSKTNEGRVFADKYLK